MGITLQSGTINDGVLYCKVTRDAVTIVNDRVYNLVDDTYYVLIAAGSSAGSKPPKPLHENTRHPLFSAGGVGFHDLTYAASGQSQSLADVSSLGAASRILIKLHGAFMLAAWIGAASVGILLARYYRQTWVGSTLCGKDQWFAVRVRCGGRKKNDASLRGRFLIEIHFSGIE